MKRFLQVISPFVLLLLAACMGPVVTPIVAPVPTFLPSQSTMTATIQPLPAYTFTPRPTRTPTPIAPPTFTELMRLGKGPIEQVTWTDDGKRFVVAGPLGIFVYDAQTLEEVKQIDTGSINDRIQSLAFTRDGQKLAWIRWSESNSDRFEIWDIPSSQLLHSIDDVGYIRVLAFSPDGRTLAVGGGVYMGVGFVKLFDVKTGRLQEEIKANDSYVDTVAFGPDGRLLAIGANGIELWDMVAHRAIRSLKSPSEFMLNSLIAPQIIFSPDGRTIAMGSHDHTVILWNTATSEVTRLLHAPSPPNRKFSMGEGSPDWTVSLAFSPNGKTIAAGQGFPDNWILIWDLNSGQLLHEIKGHADEVTGVAFRPDGRTLLSASQDNTVRL